MGRMLLLLDSSSNGVWVNGVRMARRTEIPHPHAAFTFSQLVLSHTALFAQDGPLSTTSSWGQAELA